MQTLAATEAARADLNVEMTSLLSMYQVRSAYLLRWRELANNEDKRLLLVLDRRPSTMERYTPDILLAEGQCLKHRDQIINRNTYDEVMATIFRDLDGIIAITNTNDPQNPYLEIGV